jgi:hypothetical protein
MTMELDFTGEPFDVLAFIAPPDVAPPGAAPMTGQAPPGTGLGATARQLRHSVALAHYQSLRAHAALQRKVMRDADWSR